MKKLLNVMRAQALLAGSDRASKRIGIVTSYSPDKYMAKVALQPSGVETGWLPVGADWMGNGWGMFAPPGVGAMVEVDFVGDDFDVGIVGKRLFNNEDVALSVPAGEFWLVHQSGAYFKLTNDGKGSFSDGHGADITVNGDGSISSSGRWSHTGDFNATGTVTGQTDVQGGGKSLKGHIHSGVQPGLGDTGTPV
jgi:uncharacterized protein involved in type VI secretion and phage assembly